MADRDLILLRRHSFYQPLSIKFEVHETGLRRHSTVAICHRLDRAVDVDLKLDRSPTSVTDLVKFNGRKPFSSGSISTYYDLPEALAIQVPRNVPSRRFHRSVVISGLPRRLDIRDVLCRVRGGLLTNCFTSIGPSTSGDKKEHFAILIFENSGDAASYTGFVQDAFEKDIWAFPSSDEELESKDEHKHKIAEIQYLTDLAILGMSFETDPISIPLAPRVIMPGSTRCLVIKSCPIIMIEQIFRDLRLLPLLQMQYFRSQMEDIWIDNFIRDARGRSALVDLHIWFTNINAAVDAKITLAGRFSVSANLRFEPDPCARDVLTLIRPIRQQPGHLWHSHGNISLLTLFDHGVLEKAFQDWLHVPPADDNAQKTDNAVILPVGFASEAVPTRQLEDNQATGHQNVKILAFSSKSLTITNMIQNSGFTAILGRPGVFFVSHQDSSTCPADVENVSPSDHESKGNRLIARYESDTASHGRSDTRKLLMGASSQSEIQEPQTATSPVTFLSVLYAAAVEAYNRLSPPASSYDISVAFQFSVNDIDFLEEGQIKQIAVEDDSLDDQNGAPDDNLSRCEGSSGSGTGAGTVSASGMATPHEEQVTGSTTSAQPFPNYSRANWAQNSHHKPQHVSRSCDMEEFMAMSDAQWMAFGTVFYVPPLGFATEKRGSGSVVE